MFFDNDKHLVDTIILTVSIIIIRYLQCHTVLRIIILCKVEVLLYTFATCEELHGMSDYVKIYYKSVLAIVTKIGQWLVLCQ